MGHGDPALWTASTRLAAHAAGVHMEDLSDAAVQAIKAFTLDTLGVGIAGAGSPWALGLLAAVQGWGAGDQASVWGIGGRLPVGQAAFMNAFMVHAQEFDCVHEGAVLHPFTVVVPVLMAEAGRVGLTGRRYLAACAVGVDVAVTLGLAATSQIKFFRPATCGLFGAVAALCNARGLSAALTVNAFGYALAHAAGTMQAHVEGTPALAVQVANAARSAFAAVDIAEAGLPGPKGAIDGPFGYLNLFETSHDLGRLLDDLRHRWRVAEVSWKPQPTGRAAHGGIDLAVSLRRMGVTPDTLERLEIHVPPLITHLVGRPAVLPLEMNYARLCLPYAVAVALTRGAVDLSDFTADRLNDPAIHALAARIIVTTTTNDDPAAFVPQRAVAVLGDGSSREAMIEVLPGTQARPLTREQQHAKLAANLAFGRPGTVVGCLQAALIEQCHRLDSVPDVAVLSRLASGEDVPS